MPAAFSDGSAVVSPVVSSVVVSVSYGGGCDVAASSALPRQKAWTVRQLCAPPEVSRSASLYIGITPLLALVQTRVKPDESAPKSAVTRGAVSAGRMTRLSQRLSSPFQSPAEPRKVQTSVYAGQCLSLSTVTLASCEDEPPPSWSTSMTAEKMASVSVRAQANAGVCTSGLS